MARTPMISLDELREMVGTKAKEPLHNEKKLKEEPIEGLKITSMGWEIEDDKGSPTRTAEIIKSVIDTTTEHFEDGQGIKAVLTEVEKKDTPKRVDPNVKPFMVWCDKTLKVQPAVECENCMNKKFISVLKLTVECAYLSS